MIYEVRNYYIDPTLFEQYKRWIHSGPATYLKENLDIVGFWIGTDIDTEVRGMALDVLGPANVTWVIRWCDMKHRDEIFPKLFNSPERIKLSSTNPGLKAYLRAEAKFMEQV